MTGSEQKMCQNCKCDFIIEPEDFVFYARIEVPLPTWCPECRVVRRMCFRNARTIYKRKAKGAANEVFSYFPPESHMNVYEEKYWNSDTWDAMEHGKEYDFNRPFFEQIKELIFSVPWASTYRVYSVNSDYSFTVDSVKDCYYLFNCGFSEACLYGTEVIRSRECVENTKISDCELSYELTDCEKCYRGFFSSNCVECSDIYFSSNLVDCRNCFGCVNLRHKRYHIFNEPHSKEEYEKFIRTCDLGSYRSIRSFREKAETHRIKYPVRYMHGTNNNHVTGNYIDHSRNVRNSFICEKMDNCAHCQLVLFSSTKDSYDIAVAAGELCYEVEEGGGYNVHFSWYMRPKNLKSGQLNQANEEYCVNCSNSSDLFGCVGVSDKKHCIFNKQYTKEEYMTLRSKIIAHMDAMPYIDAKGRIYKYGEFFPPELSPFAYNETIAQEYFPLTKDQAIERGYRWRDAERTQYAITMKPEEIPDNMKDVPDSIVSEIIACADAGACAHRCTGAFRIIPEELAFYHRVGIALPRRCPECRHGERIGKRNPLQLWQRQCMKPGCRNEFETSYAPNRPEIVYCEQCYQQEIA